MTVPAPNLNTLTVSPELWRLLASPTSTMAEITGNPAMVAECERCHQQLERLAEPCGDGAVMASLANLVLVYGKGEEARAKGFWKVYADALANLPRAALDRACAEYAKVGKFFPKPAEILELAEPHAGAMRSAAFRSRRALAAPVQALPPVKKISREQYETIMADFAKRMEGKDMLARTKNRMVKPSPAKLREGSQMSAEMAALMERGQ